MRNGCRIFALAFTDTGWQVYLVLGYDRNKEQIHAIYDDRRSTETLYTEDHDSVSPAVRFVSPAHG